MVENRLRKVLFKSYYLYNRKEEYKIEVLIPPNISDPLNLNAEDDSDYDCKVKAP